MKTSKESIVASGHIKEKTYKKKKKKNQPSSSPTSSLSALRLSLYPAQRLRKKERSDIPMVK